MSVAVKMILSVLFLCANADARDSRRLVQLFSGDFVSWRAGKVSDLNVDGLGRETNETIVGDSPSSSVAWIKKPLKAVTTSAISAFFKAKEEIPQKTMTASVRPAIGCPPETHSFIRFISHASRFDETECDVRKSHVGSQHSIFLDRSPQPKFAWRVWKVANRKKRFSLNWPLQSPAVSRKLIRNLSSRTSSEAVVFLPRNESLSDARIRPGDEIALQYVAMDADDAAETAGKSFWFAAAPVWNYAAPHRVDVLANSRFGPPLADEHVFMIDFHEGDVSNSGYMSFALRLKIPVDFSAFRLENAIFESGVDVKFRRLRSSNLNADLPSFHGTAIASRGTFNTTNYIDFELQEFEIQRDVDMVHLADDDFHEKTLAAVDALSWDVKRELLLYSIVVQNDTAGTMHFLRGPTASDFPSLTGGEGEDDPRLGSVISRGHREGWLGKGDELQAELHRFFLGPLSRYFPDSRQSQFAAPVFVTEDLLAGMSTFSEMEISESCPKLKNPFNPASWHIHDVQCVDKMFKDRWISGVKEITKRV